MKTIAVSLLVVMLVAILVAVFLPAILTAATSVLFTLLALMVHYWFVSVPVIIIILFWLK